MLKSLAHDILRDEPSEPIPSHMPSWPTLTQACTSEDYRHILHGVTRSETHGINTSVSILRFYIRPERQTKGFKLS